MAKKPKAMVVKDDTPQSQEQKEKDRSAGEAARWKTEIRLYERESEKFVERGKKIIKRYKDERVNGAEERKTKFNILWSNTQTLEPALFAKNPIVNVERRFQSDDDVGRFASQVLERATSFFIDDKYFDCLKEVVKDRLLPGRGTAWVRYVPKFAPKTDVVADQEDLKDVTDDDAQDELTGEEIVYDYVHWQDFGHTWARTWEEVKGAWRRVYMAQDELKRRKFNDWENIPLDHAPEKINDEKIETAQKKATIYEIWDQVNKKTLWLHKEMPELLDEITDQLGLKEFWPFPRPIFATLANDSILPIADYAEYQDQAEEIDDLTARISLLVKAVKVAGIYAGDATGIQRLLSEGLENMLVPVDNWAMYADKGGLKGAIEYLPLEMIMMALKGLYESRDQAKKDLYEISGMSDILRGQGDPNETAKGVETKGKFGTMRLNSMQSEVARFNRDMVRITAEIICTHCSADTIKEISGVKLMTVEEKKQAQALIQQAAMQAQQQPPVQGQTPQTPPSPPPVPEKLAEALQNPTWEDVLALLKNDTQRAFRIDIEINSTIKMDQDRERQDRIDFLQAAGEFLQAAATVSDPTLKPLMMEMLMFAIRGFHVAKDIESAFEVAQKKVEKEAQSPTPKQDPEMVKTQGLLELEKMKMQAQQQSSMNDMKIEQAKAQKDAEMESARAQADNEMEAQKFNHQREVDAHKQAHDNLKLQLSHALEMAKIQSAEKQTRASLSAKGGDGEAAADEHGLAGGGSKLDAIKDGQQQTMQAVNQIPQAMTQQMALMEKQMQALLNLAQGQSQTMEGIEKTIAAIKSPKKVIRDAKGRVAGVISE